MDRLLEILENNQKKLNELVKIYGPLKSHTSIDQNDSQRRPYSKRVHVVLQQEQPWEVKEGQRRGAKLFTLGSELQHTN